MGKEHSNIPVDVDARRKAPLKKTRAGQKSSSTTAPPNGSTAQPPNAPTTETRKPI